MDQHGGHRIRPGSGDPLEGHGKKSGLGSRDMSRLRFSGQERTD